jgi:DNA (cytosine-5)-methyltransferase 1
MERYHDLSSLEICAGAGGQALGLENAGFSHVAAIEYDGSAWETLKLNRPEWKPRLADVREVDGTLYRGIDLFAGGVPCPPFSIAGKQLGESDERDLFPTALRLIAASEPRAVMLENVPGFAKAKFADYRERIEKKLRKLGFTFVEGQVLNASNFGVSQLRPRFVLIALRGKAAERFEWPRIERRGPTVGQLLLDLMSSRNWKAASSWAERANGIAPTLVGGSKLHGGPDLGPSRAKAAWRQLAVNGNGVADLAPDSSFPADGLPKLTVRMAARIQGFPDSWQFAGKKTASYRQVGNAFPPPVAQAVGAAIRQALTGQIVRAVAERKQRYRAV